MPCLLDKQFGSLPIAGLADKKKLDKQPEVEYPRYESFKTCESLGANLTVTMCPFVSEEQRDKLQ